ncbi:MAG TPA: creatininase family protein [Patescibacteria group bacterium]|nr:creatininase family protein [Patescibacteria group bacterium]
MSENGKLSKFWLWELTRPAFEDWIDNESEPVVIIGIGSIEQHGPHLPLGMDSLAARYFVHEIAKRSNSICLHPCWPGYSPHHMGFRGTVTFREDTLLNVLMDVIGSLSDHGVKRFVLTNHHGGNNNIFRLAMQMAKRYHGVMVTAPSGPSDTELAKKMGEISKKHWDVHSGINETAAALYMFPELVEMVRVKGWKPTLDIDPKLMEFMDTERPDYELVSQIRSASGQPDTDDFSSDGIYGTGDPNLANPEEYGKRMEERVNFMVEFIKLWKTIPIPPAYKD